MIKKETPTKSLAFMLIFLIVISLAGILIVFKNTNAITGYAINNINKLRKSGSAANSILTTVYVIILFSLSLILLVARKY